MSKLLLILLILVIALLLVATGTAGNVHEYGPSL
jgi:hypothetical protein